MQPTAQTQTATRPIVLIPAYGPDAGLPEIARELMASGEVEAVIVVDDGSGPKFERAFAAAAAVNGVTVLRHVVNLGKGAALKTGLNAIACRYPGHVGIVTADADGQHKVGDILRTARALTAHPRSLVLGVRDFRTDVPLRSRIGNIVTRAVMRFVTGHAFTDTQTGLRGIPMEFVPDLMRSKPNGYDFELDMLLICRDARRDITEVGIETVYLDGNRASHFNPLVDSMRIYFVFLRFAGVSMITAAIDNTVFLGLHHSWGSIIGCQFASRTVAGVFNYSANKLEVFHSRARNTTTLPRYCISVVAQGLVSYFLFTNLSRLLKIDVALAKVGVETALFFASFVVQREFVFRGKRE
jgi:putative flippase GtrA